MEAVNKCFLDIIDSIERRAFGKIKKYNTQALTGHTVTYTSTGSECIDRAMKFCVENGCFPHDCNSNDYRAFYWQRDSTSSSRHLAYQIADKLTGRTPSSQQADGDSRYSDYDALLEALEDLGNALEDEH